jgi:hypothetical protein
MSAWTISQDNILVQTQQFLGERIWSFGFERSFHGTQDVVDGDGGGGPGFDPEISEADPSSDERHSWKHGFVQK